MQDNVVTTTPAAPTAAMRIDLVKREGREPMPVVVAAVDAMKGVDLADLGRKLGELAELFGHVRKPARS